MSVLECPRGMGGCRVVYGASGTSDACRKPLVTASGPPTCLCDLQHRCLFAPVGYRANQTTSRMHSAT